MRAHICHIQPELVGQIGFDRTFRVYTLAAALVGAGFADFALSAFHISRVGVTPLAWIPILYALALASEGASALVIGSLPDRFGTRVMPLGIALASLSTPLLFLGDVTARIVGAALWGVGMAVLDTAFHALLSQHVPSDRRATAYGLLDALRGKAWLGGSLALGLFYGLNLTALVATSFVLRLGAIPVLVVAGRARGR